MMTNLIYEWTYIPHRNGKDPKIINVVWGDGRASVMNNAAVFNQSAQYWNTAAGLGAGPGEPGYNTQFLNMLAQIQQ